MDMLPPGRGVSLRAVWIAIAATAVVTVGIAGYLVGRDAAPAATSQPDRPAAVSATSNGLSAMTSADRRAADRRTKSDLRNAFVAEKTLYVDAQQFAIAESDFDGSGYADLVEIEPSLRWVTGASPVAEGSVFVSVQGFTLYLSARSPAGSCFYLSDDASGATRYATDPSCRPVTSQTWSTTPW